MNQHMINSNEHVNASPILAIHGSASNGSLWDRLAKEQVNNRLILAPDLQGYGAGDSKKINLNATLESRADPIMDLVSRLDQGVHVVAHSFGASVALAITKMIPESVRSLTFYEPVVPALLRDSEQEGDLELLADLQALSEVVRGTTAQVGMETFINFWSEPKTWERFPESTRAKLVELAPIVYQDFVEAYHNTSPNTFKWLEYKGSLKLLLGERANPHCKRMASILFEQFPLASCDVLPGMGHMGPLTHSNEVHASIVNHVEHVEAKEAAVLASFISSKSSKQTQWRTS